MGGEWVNHAGEKVRQEILQLLESKRKKLNSSWSISRKQSKFRYRSTLESDVCSMSSDAGQELTSSRVRYSPEFQEEKFTLVTEDGEQGRVPVVVIKTAEDGNCVKRRPVVVFLHCTGKSKEAMRASMESFAARGYVTVAIDSRYHGERAKTSDAYRNALIRAWVTGEEMPFIFDTVWDLIKLVDYLHTRQDVDPARIGMLGISLGGMHAWYAAVADSRISVVVPMIAVQCFRWAVRNNMWHARVQSIPDVFEVATHDLGKSAVDSETVAIVWRRIAPGLMDQFDAEKTVPAIAPRPLLILNGQEDKRCPIRGLQESLSRATEIYRTAGVAENFSFKAQEGVDHAICDSMLYDASVWMDRHLRPDTPITKEFSSFSKGIKFQL